MSQPSLSTNRAFVVQFRAQAAEAPLSWEGRIEHLVSGQVGRFHSPEDWTLAKIAPRHSLHHRCIGAKSPWVPERRFSTLVRRPEGEAWTG